MPILRLPPGLQADIRAAAVAGYPDEVCGLLFGSATCDETRVVRLYPVRNARETRARDRFEIAPLDYLAAEDAAGRQGVAIVGVWHSHPDHPARPSTTDRQFAWPGWSYPIVSVGADGCGEFRSWRFADDGFSEEEVLP